MNLIQQKSFSQWLFKDETGLSLINAILHWPHGFDVLEHSKVKDRWIKNQCASLIIHIQWWGVENFDIISSLTSFVLFHLYSHTSDSWNLFSGPELLSSILSITWTLTLAFSPFIPGPCGSLSFSLLIFYSDLSPLFCFSCLTTSLTFTQLPPTFYRRKTPMSKTDLVEIHWLGSTCYLPLDVLITFITMWYVT